MHAFPHLRDVEIEGRVLESSNAVVVEQAENRLQPSAPSCWSSWADPALADKTIDLGTKKGRLRGAALLRVKRRLFLEWLHVEQSA
jgi:hypothetical protein